MRDAANEPNRVCPKCDYRMWVGEVKAPAGVEVSFLVFCPLCHTELDRMDALGEIEAEMRGEPRTFEEFQAQEHVLGTIHAEVPDGEA